MRNGIAVTVMVGPAATDCTADRSNEGVTVTTTALSREFPAGWVRLTVSRARTDVALTPTTVPANHCQLRP
jgi:hypothetical protein